MADSLKLGDPGRKKTIVISHERSGTHFLMNTLEQNFGYIAKTWINFDYNLSFNFHVPQSLLDFIKQFHDKPVLNIIKSHHHIDFFKDTMDYLSEQFHIFYICRDPRDVIKSYRKFLYKLPWDEGPKEATAGEFMRAAPRGGLLRFQKEQSETMLHRWQDHVASLMDYMESAEGQKIILLRYEDLDREFDMTVRKISSITGQAVDNPVRPDRTDNVILPGNKLQDASNEFTPEDDEFVLKTVGRTMERLGYRC